MRVLVLSNMLPSAAHPERGQFVRDQIAALRSLGQRDSASPPAPSRAGDAEDSRPGVADSVHDHDPADPLEVELYEFAPGGRALARAAWEVRRRYRGQRFDVVHAHFGLTAWPALGVRARVRGLTMHGTDLAHPRTRLFTRAILPLIDLPLAASPALLDAIPGRRARARASAIGCGVDTDRFRPMPRAQARAALGLEPEGRYLLFAADPARSEKRHDRALALAQAVDARLLTLGGVAPERVPLYVNAAQAVLVPSEREGFGLAVLEALACEVPVLATPVGIHPQALHGIAGALCVPFELDGWRALAGAHLAEPDPRVQGRERAQRYSCATMAGQLARAWRSLIAQPG